jgi:hypothetical protein
VWAVAVHLMALPLTKRCRDHEAPVGRASNNAKEHDAPCCQPAHALLFVARRIPSHVSGKIVRSRPYRLSISADSVSEHYDHHLMSTLCRVSGSRLPCVQSALTPLVCQDFREFPLVPSDRRLQ